MDNENQVSVILLSKKIEDLTYLTEQLNDFFKGHMALVNPINLIIEELYSNSINYGKAKNLEVKVTLEMKEHTLKIKYEDNGIAFNPLTEAKQPDLESDLEVHAIGGLGVHFIKNMTDNQSYQRINEINQLTLEKEIN